MKNMKQTNFRILVGLVAIILAASITLQVRTMKKASSEISFAFVNDELKDTLLSWRERYQEAANNLENSNKQLAEARKNAASRTQETEEIAAKLKINNMLLGLTDVTGNGIQIKVEDSKVTLITEDINLYLVHDADLREILNELANAGAEAVEINGERIVVSTCITCAGNIISINGTRISSPFIIKAIGNQETLYGAITRPGGYIQLMQNQTIPTEVKKVQNITISKYSGVLKSDYMESVKE